MQSHIVCAAARNRHYQIFVDGARVPGSLWEVHGLAGQTFTEHGMTFGVVSAGAGTHKVQLRASNSPGVSSHLDVLPSVGAIGLGG